MSSDYLNRSYQHDQLKTELYQKFAQIIKESPLDPKLDLEIIEDIHLDLLKFVDEIVREEKKENADKI